MVKQKDNKPITTVAGILARTFEINQLLAEPKGGIPVLAEGKGSPEILAELAEIKSTTYRLNNNVINIQKQQEKAREATPQELKKYRKIIEDEWISDQENKTMLSIKKYTDTAGIIIIISTYIEKVLRSCSYDYFISLPFDYSMLLAMLYIERKGITEPTIRLTKRMKQDINTTISIYLEPESLKNPIKDFTPGALLSYSTSPALHLFSRILNTSGSDRDLKTKNRNITIEEYLNNKELTVKYTSSSNEVIITLDNIDYLTKSKKDNTKKILIYILSMINNSVIDIEFNLKDLVDLEIYGSMESARSGFKNCMNNLLSYKVGGETKRGSKKIRSEKGVLFTYYKIENNICTVTLNEKINYSFISQYYPCIPVWAFSLNKIAFNLMEYITYQARQNAKTIKETGKFKIGLETISNHIGLPSPKETPKHSEWIIDPLLNAITLLEEKQKGTEYKFTPYYNENYNNAADFLQGHLEIEINGKMQEKLINIQNSKLKEATRSDKKLLKNH